MREKMEILELNLVVRARDHNPSILNPDFLKHNEIVPAEWELADAPICSAIAAQVRYKNGVNILAQQQLITFVEPLSSASTEEARIPRIAKKYCETLPHVRYDAIGINPKGQVVADSKSEAEAFLLDAVIKPGPWRTHAGGAKRANVTFVYSVNDARLTLTAESGETMEQTSFPKGTPVLVFQANFHRETLSSEPTQRLEQLATSIDCWETDLTEFQSIVNDCFLKGGETDA